MSEENSFLVKEVEEESQQIAGTGHDCVQGSRCSYSPDSRTNSAQ